MIFNFVKRVQESVIESDKQSSAGMFSEADQSALMTTYEDAILVCESLQANMVRASLTQMQLFSEANGSEELYIASLFDKAKGLFVSIWKVIVDAFKAVTNWIKGLFGKVTKATSKNLEQIDKLSKLITLKNKDLGIYGVNWSVPDAFKIEYKSAVTAVSAAAVGYELWRKNKFDELKLSPEYTAGQIYKEKMQKGVTDAIVALLSNDDAGITEDKKKPIKDAGAAVDSVVNALRGNNQSGFTGDGASKKSKQLKFFISGLLFASPENFFKGHPDRSGAGVLSDNEVVAIVDDIVAKIKSDNKLFLDIITTPNASGISEKIRKIALQVVGAKDTTLTYVGKNGNVIDMILGYIEASGVLAASKFMSVPEDAGDVKAYLMKTIFDDRIPKTITKENFESYYIEMACLVLYINGWMEENKIKTVQNNFAEGEKFFSNIAKEYQVIYDQMKKVVDNNTNISGKPNMTDITSSLNGMIRGAGELTSWFTTGIIQTYAIGDMLTTRGFVEVHQALAKFAEIQDKQAIIVAN